MKMDLHRPVAVAATFCVLLLTACGSDNKETPEVQVNKTEACTAAVIPNRYIVKYRNGKTKVVYAKSDRMMAQKLTDDVAFAEPDYYVKRDLATADATVTPSQTVDVDNWGVIRVGADALWRANINGQGIAVAVIDSGMDITHPQLANQLFYNSAEKAGNGLDDDRNGYVDDSGGWDFTRSAPLKVDNGIHGTHVSGIIAAQHSDTQAAPAPYVQGIAPQSKLLPLAFIDETGSGAISDAVQAIDYAAARGVRVINASWGGPVCSRSMQESLDALAASKIVFISASGNEGINLDYNREYPASFNFANQITVGASAEYDYMAQYSNYGYEAVHMFAPGSNIGSTIPKNALAYLSGTSMAAPIVTGAVALLLSAEPSATPTQIRQALYASAYRGRAYANASRGRMDLRTSLSELRRLLAAAAP
jgi:subtilisin family serine protease